MIDLQNLLDDANCYETVRQLRWPDGVRRPHCGAAAITKRGRDTTQPARRKYRCEDCHRYFDDLTETVLAGHHQPCEFGSRDSVGEFELRRHHSGKSRRFGGLGFETGQPCPNPYQVHCCGDGQVLQAGSLM